MSDTTSIGDRFKAYENVFRTNLVPRMPLIIRCNNRVSFRNYAKIFEKPTDPILANGIMEAGKALVSNVLGAKLAYIQSDEISVLINDYENFDTKAWFDKSIQKVVSVSASIATAYFNKYMYETGYWASTATFDSRTFVLPKEEVYNYFLWRMLDAERKSVFSLAQSHFSHKSLHKKKCDDMKLMLLQEKGIDWNTLPTQQKRGWCVLKGGIIDLEIPRFQEDRDYIEKHILQIQ